jgi:hypothetical protein
MDEKSKEFVERKLCVCTLRSVGPLVGLVVRNFYETNVQLHFDADGRARQSGACSRNERSLHGGNGDERPTLDVLVSETLGRNPELKI